MNRIGWLVLLGLLYAARASAHAFTPAGIWIEETAPQEYEVQFRRSARLADRLTLDLPQRCTRGPIHRLTQGEEVVDAFKLGCEVPLQGQTLGVVGLSDLSPTAVLQAKLKDGRSVRAVLSTRRARITLPKNSWLAEVFVDYLKLGIEHLLTGWDHILFVVGLLCLMSELRQILITLTAFTLGHSITLALSSLSVIRLPQAPVEVGIALSLLVVASEIAVARTGEAPATQRLSRTQPFRIAGAFGLLHGLGFAGALAEVGLPESEIPLCLLAFNLGVELGQVLIAAIALAVLFGVRRLGREQERSLRLGAAYVIGSLAVMWCLERMTTL